MPQGLDLLGWITLKLGVCVHVNTRIISKGIVLIFKYLMTMH